MKGLIALLLFATICVAQPPPQAPAPPRAPVPRVAPPQAPPVRGCNCGPDCQCVPGNSCGCLFDIAKKVEVKQEAKPIAPKAEPPPGLAFPHWEDAYVAAYADGKRMVVFVSCTPRNVPGARVGVEKGTPEVWVMVPNGKEYARWRLPASASDGQILEALARKVVQPVPAAPFRVDQRFSAPARSGSC